MTNKNANSILFLCNFLSKGWEVSILAFLAFIQDKSHMHISMVGILSSVFIISQISVSFFAGRIAHAVHSRNVVFLSITASGLSWLTLFLSGFYFSFNHSMLFLAYMLGGVSSGLFEPIGNSLVAKLSSSKNRSTAIGNFAAFGDMGRIAVMAGATALAVGIGGDKLFGVTLPVIIAHGIGVNGACGVMFVSAVVVFFLVSYAIASSAEGDEVVEEAPVHLAQLVRNRKFCYATIAGIADSSSSASLYIFLPFLLTTKGIPLANSLYFNVVFFAGYMSGRLVLGRLADKHGASRMLMSAKVAMAGLILLLTMAKGPLMTAAFLFVLGIFTRGSSPIIRAMVADSMEEGISFHNAFSTFSSTSRGSSAVSRPLFGILASCPILGMPGINTVFYAASLVSLATLYPAAKYKRLVAALPPSIEPPHGGQSLRPAMTDRV
jgi:MFS transporter, FSR family, fosmidomycin resistance protein